MPTLPMLQRRSFLKGAAAAAIACNPVLAAGQDVHFDERFAAFVAYSVA